MSSISKLNVIKKMLADSNAADGSALFPSHSETKCYKYLEEKTGEDSSDWRYYTNYHFRNNTHQKKGWSNYSLDIHILYNGQVSFSSSNSRLYKGWIISFDMMQDLFLAIEAYHDAIDNNRKKISRKDTLKGMSYKSKFKTELESLNLDDKDKWDIDNDKNTIFIRYDGTAVYSAKIRKRPEGEDLKTLIDNFEHIILFIKNIHLKKRGRFV